MTHCELVSLVTAVSCAIANCVSREELPLVTAIFGQIASTLTTITEQDDLLNPLPNAAPPIEATPPSIGLIATPPGA